MLRTAGCWRAAGCSEGFDHRCSCSVRWWLFLSRISGFNNGVSLPLWPKGPVAVSGCSHFPGPSFCQSGPSWFNSVPSLPVLGSQGGAYLPSRVQQQVMSELFVCSFSIYHASATCQDCSLCWETGGNPPSWGSSSLVWQTDHQQINA